jgi:hypothetical protein
MWADVSVFEHSTMNAYAVWGIGGEASDMLWRCVGWVSPRASLNEMANKEKIRAPADNRALSPCP